MDGPTLSRAMGATLPAARYATLAPAFTKALAQAGCTTVNRAAMFCAQVAHESAGLKWMEELASGSAYEGRDDLGNTHKGDGVRFKGRGPIQVTGRHNYTALSTWAHRKGYVPTGTYFVDNPGKLASDRYGFLGVVWYWTVARNMNAYADRKDIRGATLAVNGGTRGLAERTAAWNRCRSIGKALLAGTTAVPVKVTAKVTPLHPTLNAIHTPYGKTGTMWQKGWHQGDDWHRGAGAAEIGDPIVAVAAGRIIHVGETRNDSPGWGPSFGLHVLNTWDDTHPGDGGTHRTSIDAHMSRVAVKYGQLVKPGDIIGYKGATGNVNGPHDHHEQHLGQGYGSKVVKPIYPGKITTTKTEATMAPPKKYRRTKDRKLSKSKAYHMMPLDNAGKKYSMITGPGTVKAVANINTNKDCWARFVTVNKKGSKVKYATRYPRVKVKAGGDQLELWDTIGGPAKGFDHKYVRLEVLAYSSVVVVKDLMVRCSKEA